MKNTHTPGPWTVCADNAIEIREGSYYLERVSPELGLRIKDADANLIAAAPDLLDACELVDRAATGDGVEMSTAVDACLLAIAKAKGEAA